ncbi:MAG: 3-hexulose-6-phosphate synthase [Anaerolineae bacterium]
MKFQLALDGSLSDSLMVLKQTHTYVDIVEVGTPLVHREGIHAVQRILKAYPNLSILADFKIMDAGEYEATIAFEAGCDYVTILGMAYDVTVRSAVKAARHYGKTLVADMIGVSDIMERSKALLDMGVQVLCFHSAYDLRFTQRMPSETLKEMRAQLGKDVPLSIAGGIKLENIDEVLPYQPDFIVVGSGITQADDPGQAARNLSIRIRDAT